VLSFADDLIRMAEGKTTIEKLREGGAKRETKPRAKLPSRDGNSGTKPKSKPDEDPLRRTTSTNLDEKVVRFSGILSLA